MKKIIIFMLIALSVNYSILNSQNNVTQAWVQRYDGGVSDWDEPKDIAIDKLGNLYVTGYSFVNSNSRVYLTIKYNSSGVQQWVQSYNNGSGLTFAIVVDDSSYVYVTGDNFGNGSDIVTIKYNDSGIQQWASRYNGPANGEDNGREIAVDKTGNVYVSGWSQGIGTSDDYITIKYNNSGIQQWAARYNGSANLVDWARSVAVDSSGNVYVTGASNETNGDITTIKYNLYGIQQWVASYNSPWNWHDTGYDIELDKFNNVYIAGYVTDTVGSGNFDYVTIKYNSSGTQQWARIYNGPGNGDDVSRWMAVDTSGNVYVTGYSWGGMSSHEDYATIKYDSSGFQQWVARYNGAAKGTDYVRNIALDRLGNVYVTGYSYVLSGGTFDFATIKYNGITGTQQWAILYNGTGDSSDYGWALAVDSLYNVYVTGSSFGIGSGRDFATIKYSQPIGIQQISGQIPSSYKLEQNYPNPFNPITHIKFQMPHEEFVKLAVFDVLGREISVLVNEKLKPGIYEVSWNAANYVSGVYFYTLNTSSYAESKKMIVIK